MPRSPITAGSRTSWAATRRRPRWRSTCTASRCSWPVRSRATWHGRPTSWRRLNARRAHLYAGVVERGTAARATVQRGQRAWRDGRDPDRRRAGRWRLPGHRPQDLRLVVGGSRRAQHRRPQPRRRPCALPGRAGAAPTDCGSRATGIRSACARRSAAPWCSTACSCRRRTSGFRPAGSIKPRPAGRTSTSRSRSPTSA